MATTLFFDGRLTSVPGAYSKTDASGLEQIGLGSTGIVAVLGTAEGGRPAGQIEKLDDVIRITRPGTNNNPFRSGDLYEVGDMLWSPARDENIPGGAAQIVAMKVNPAVQGAATLPNVQGDALDLLAKDWGAFTNQINVSIQNGTSKGKLLSIIFEDITETVDDLGADEFFKLTYDKPTNGWDTMAGEVITGGSIVASGTRDVAGLDGDVTPLAAQGNVQVVSSDVGDTTQKVTVYGLDAAGDPVKETLDLDGTTPKVGTQVFGLGDVLGVLVDGVTVGNVLVRDNVGPTTILTITAGNTTSGLKPGVTMYVSGGKVTVAGDGATTKDLLLVGTAPSGAVQLEKLLLNGATNVVSTGDWATITAIVLGDVEAGVVVTVSAEAAKANALTQKTLQKAADYFNSRAVSTVGGFVFDLVTGMTTFLLSNLDVTPATQNILDPANPSFYADLWAMKNWINSNSQLFSAEFSTGASGGAVTNTASPVFLTGGSEGVAQYSDWLTALNALKKVRVDTVVPLTNDPAVHAQVQAHCAYMGGAGKSERDGVVGIADEVTGDLLTKSTVKSRIVDLNSRHLRATAQAIERYNVAGERTEFGPQFEAAIVAGMQAGSPIGEPTTFKYANALSVRQHSSWNPVDDAEEMINAGLWFLEELDGVGKRNARNVTTHLTSNNIAYVEASVNEAANVASYNFRTNMEFAVGRRGFAGTINAAKGVALDSLGLLVDETVLVKYRSLDISLAVDVLAVSVEMAPVIGINFVPITIHLVTVQQTAA